MKAFKFLYKCPHSQYNESEAFQSPYLSIRNNETVVFALQVRDISFKRRISTLFVTRMRLVSNATGC